MTVRTMLDAVDANDVPAAGWDLLAGYVNGHYRSYLPLKQRFPHATVVSIDVLNNPGAGQVLDIERGDARPDEAPRWFDESLAEGVIRPTLYYSSSDHAAIKAYMGSRKFDAWVASYGVSHCPVHGDAQVTVVAWQKTNHGPHGENVDISDVFDPYWPNAAPTGGLFMTLKPEEEQEILKAARVVNTEVARTSGSLTVYQAVTEKRGTDPHSFNAIDTLKEMVQKVLDKLS